MSSRPYQPDTGAAAAEEAAVRRVLAAGTVALAPRSTGWVVVTEEPDGALTEPPVLHPGGSPVLPWDTEGLSRWMRRRDAPPPRESLLKRLGSLFRR